ncbi:hypothetical protein TBR22_A28950 [Luteitalea sp. TBR-22]|nr:hypothetical protein TBR22_A28950 [Luteitalea sp. TBR-22]
MAAGGPVFTPACLAPHPASRPVATSNIAARAPPVIIHGILSTPRGRASRFVLFKDAMLDPLVRLVRLIHMTIGISEPKPAEERTIALAWLALFLALLGIFVFGLFVLG